MQRSEGEIVSFVLVFSVGQVYISFVYFFGNISFIGRIFKSRRKTANM